MKYQCLAYTRHHSLSSMFYDSTCTSSKMFWQIHVYCMTQLMVHVTVWLHFSCWKCIEAIDRSNLKVVCFAVHKYVCSGALIYIYWFCYSSDYIDDFYHLYWSQFYVWRILWTLFLFRCQIAKTQFYAHHFLLWFCWLIFLHSPTHLFSWTYVGYLWFSVLSVWIF